MKYGLLLLTVFVLVSCVDTTSNKNEITQVKEENYSYDVEKKLEELNIVLADAPPPIANYVNVVRSGNLLFLAGKGPRKPVNTDQLDENFPLVGRLGESMTIEQGYEAARLTAITQLSVLKAELGDLNKVKRIVKVLGMVNCTEDFVDQPKVVNGFSDLMVEVFGERGKHARAAVGMASLPSGIPVEIEMIVEIDED
ncbi:MAG: RidA family protein [Cyclobacteriaceae bacterium]|nr:RidA family protein [Cyclobacteriaceae bacterium]